MLDNQPSYKVFIVEKTTNTLIELTTNRVDLITDEIGYNVHLGYYPDVTVRNPPDTILKGCEDIKVTRFPIRLSEISENELMELIGVNDV